MSDIKDKLFEYMSREHDVNLLDTDMEDIIHIITGDDKETFIVMLKPNYKSKDGLIKPCYKYKGKWYAPKSDT